MDINICISMYNVLLVHVVLKVAPIVGRKLSSILKHLLQKPEWKYLIPLQWWISSTPVDSVWLNDTIWRQGSRSALTQILVCRLMAPICCLSWCWLETIIYTAVQLYSKYKKHILLSLLSPITITIITFIIIIIIIITTANITVIINLLTYYTPRNEV